MPPTFRTSPRAPPGAPQGFRTPWVDHPPSDEFVKFHEQAWLRDRQEPEAVFHAAAGHGEDRH